MSQPLSSDLKNSVLLSLGRILGAAEARILVANEKDCVAAQAAGISAAFLDRLRLTPERLRQMQNSILQVASLPDPIGQKVESKTLANGLKVNRVRAPLGRLLFIFESRPNVATEAFSLAFKSGNAITLRGGKEAAATLTEIYASISRALKEAAVSDDFFDFVTDPDRALLGRMLADSKRFDAVIPRGGEALIRFVSENARMPMIKNDRGMCHLYVHADADLSMAANILVNGKTQRPSVCNALETVLIDRSILEFALTEFENRLASFGVTYVADPESLAALKKIQKKMNIADQRLLAASAGSYDTEYLDLVLNVGVVDGPEQALEHIQKHGSGHSEAIVTENEKTAEAFLASVDAAVSYWNASTRFTDGFELGLGGEIGISTQKFHVRGPVGLEALTSVRWVVRGKGQVRK